MSEERFQTSSDGIDPVEYIKAYFTHLTEREISVLVGSIALLQEVDLSILQSVLDLDQIEVEEKIGRLMQSDLLEGKFTSTHFNLESFNYAIKQQHPNLTLDDRIFLAYLKARFEVGIKELEQAFDLSYPSAIYLLSGFVAKGLLSSQKIDNDKFQFVVHYRYPKRNASRVTEFESQLVGYFQFKGTTTIAEVANELEEPEHKVISTFSKLILSDMITAKFESSSSIFGGIQLNIILDRFQVFFERKSIQVLSNDERNYIGYLSLRRNAKIKEIADIINLDRISTIKLAASLHSTNQFLVEMSGDILIVAEYRPMSINRSIEVLSQIHSFNYRILLGILQTQRRISIREIANLMKSSEVSIIDALISSYIEGMIDGHLNDRKIFHLSAVRQHEKTSEMTLERWERIILGTLISERVISWPKVAALLEIDRDTARNRAFEFISRSITKTIAKDTVLALEEEPNLPPLVQVHALNHIEQQILGYLKLVPDPTIREIKSKFNLSNIEVFREIYYLAGSGLFKLRRNKNRLHVSNMINNEPQESVKELDLVKQQIIRAIEGWGNEINLKELSKEVELRIDRLEKYLFEIIASGYYEGTLKKATFLKKSSLIALHDAGICLYCTESLEKGSTHCGSCSRRLPDCGVCKGTLNSNEQLLACPHCKNQNHANHIKQWLEIKGECPFCREKISISQLLVQQPLL